MMKFLIPDAIVTSVACLILHTVFAWSPMDATLFWLLQFSAATAAAASITTEKLTEQMRAMEKEIDRLKRSV